MGFADDDDKNDRPDAVSPPEEGSETPITHQTGVLNRPRPRADAPPSQPPVTVLKEASPAPPPTPAEQRAETSRVRLVPEPSSLPSWRAIFIVVYPMRATIGLDVRQTVIIGRADAVQQDVGPVLDLIPYRAVEQGVSRQHAALLPTNEGLLLSDLGSTNGTWVNGTYLAPGTRHKLAPGDLVELGLLRLEVRSLTPLIR
jgi:hypothetical protein